VGKGLGLKKVCWLYIMDGEPKDKTLCAFCAAMEAEFMLCLSAS
jgi:hypothetical protein